MIAAKTILEQVAYNYGVDVTEVEEEIKQAITKAMEHPSQSVQKFWSDVPRNQDIPTAEELVAYLAERIIELS